MMQVDQQYVIEEEVSQEEQEDSPTMAVKGTPTKIQNGFKLMRAEEEEAVEEEDRYEDDINDDIGVVEEDDEDDGLSAHSLIYQINVGREGLILQVLRAPSGDPDNIFIIKQCNQEGEVLMSQSINIETVQEIAKAAKLPMESIEQ
jgi:hypothetical protein